MTQAIANPEDLRQFAQRLSQFNDLVAEQGGLLAAQLDALSTSWRDQENTRFSEEFHQHLHMLSQFLEANQQHVPYLMRKADRLDEYLQQR